MKVIDLSRCKFAILFFIFVFCLFCFQFCLLFLPSCWLSQLFKEFYYDLSIVYFSVSLCIALQWLGQLLHYMYITSQSIDIIILPVQRKYRNLISLYILLSSPTYNIVVLSISSTFRTISDSGIIFTLIIKHNTEHLRGKGKSIVFTHNFAYHILFSFLMLQVFCSCHFLSAWKCGTASQGLKQVTRRRRRLRMAVGSTTQTHDC